MDANVLVSVAGTALIAWLALRGQRESRAEFRALREEARDANAALATRIDNGFTLFRDEAREAHARIMRR